MKVKECILSAATQLGIGDDIEEYFSGASTLGEADALCLLRCFNLVENELALDYLPLFCEDTLESGTGAVFFSELSQAAVRIVKVMDERGEELPFTLFPEYLKTQAGKLVIRYTYTPKEKGFEDESSFVLYASVRLFAYGIAAEYALANGLFEEAAVWDKKYKDAIAAAYRSRKAKKIQSRRWV